MESPGRGFLVASWCPSCSEGAPALLSLRTHQGAGLKIRDKLLGIERIYNLNLLHFSGGHTFFVSLTIIRPTSSLSSFLPSSLCSFLPSWRKKAAVVLVGDWDWPGSFLEYLPVHILVQNPFCWRCSDLFYKRL